MPSGYGMGEERFNHIKDNIHLLEVDYKNGKVLNRKEFLNGHGYLIISLKDKNIPTHQIIGFLKFGEKCVGLTINHENGRKTDNEPDNLELMTNGDNTRHAYRTGIAQNVKGEKHALATITDGQAWQVKWMFWRGLKQREISEMLGIPPHTVAKITQGRSWKHIPCNNLGIKRMKMKDQGLMAAK